jgi:hypothetical protein
VAGVTSNVSQIPPLVGELYKIVRTLNELFRERPFTDGHLVGSIGEVVAAFLYGLKLEKCSTPGFDARTSSGQTVEISSLVVTVLQLQANWKRLRTFSWCSAWIPRRGLR